MCSCGCNNCSNYDGGCGCSSFDGDDSMIGLDYDGFSLKDVFGTKESRQSNKSKKSYEKTEKRLSKLPSSEEKEVMDKEKQAKKEKKKQAIKDIIAKLGNSEKAKELIANLNPTGEEINEVSAETNVDLSDVPTSDDNTMLYVGIGGGILALIIIYFLVIK